MAARATASGRRWLPALLLAGLVLALIEGGSRLTIFVLERRTPVVFQTADQRMLALGQAMGQLLESQGETLLELDPELGWIYRGGHRSPEASSNSRGLRGTREYGAKPPGGLRIAAYGDSFVFGNEVKDAEAWTAVLEGLEAEFEVLNRGVGGYGNDQALLLLRRELEADDPDLVIFGFTEVQLARNLNRFRRFLSPHDLPLPKPRFVLEADGDLRLVPNPFPDRADLEEIRRRPEAVLAAGAGDAFFDAWVWNNRGPDRLASVRLLATALPRAWRSRLGPGSLYRGGRFNPRSEALALCAALIERAAREVRASGREFLWMVFPGRDEDIWGDEERTYAALIERLAELSGLDLADALSVDPAIGPENLRAPGGHYSHEGNAAVARAVRDAVLGPTSGVYRGSVEERP